MEKLRNYLNENQERYLNIVKAQRMSPRTIFAKAIKDLREFQTNRNDVKLGFTGKKYLQAVKVDDEIWYTILEDNQIKCISMYLLREMSVNQLINKYKKN